MQHLKLTIASLNQTFLYRGNFRDVNYNQLVEFASSKLGRALQNAYFEYQCENANIKIIDDATIKCVQQATTELVIVKLVLVEVVPLQEPPAVEELPAVQAAQVVHNYRCSSCGIYPIQNLRYQCFVCKRLHFCENCLKHGDEHPLIRFSRPQQESFLGGFFSATVQHVQNLFSKSVHCSKRGLSEIRQMIASQKQRYQEKRVQKQYSEQEEFNEKLLRLSEIFEEDPITYVDFVKQHSDLNISQLLEEAAKKYA